MSCRAAWALRGRTIAMAVALDSLRRLTIEITIVNSGNFYNKQHNLFHYGALSYDILLLVISLFFFALRSF